VNTITAPVPRNSRPSNLTLRPLFPDLSEEKLREVEDFFYGYLEIVWDIYQEAERRDPHRFDKKPSPS